MQTEKTLSKLMEYLLKRGYPQKSIAVEYPFGKHRADLVVIDTDTKRPIQVFEIKASRNHHSEEAGRTQLKRCYDYAKENGFDITTYLVFPSDQAPFVDVDPVNVIEPSQEGNQKLLVDDMLDYDAQSNRDKSVNRDNVKNEQRKTIGDVWKAAWGTASVVFFLAILEYSKRIELTETRLYLLGLIVFLVLLPFYPKIKFNNMEFDSCKKEKKHDE